MSDRPATLLESVSPNGNVAAIVEADERCAYFYLHGAPETGLGVRSCWVRNLVAALDSVDVAAMKQGRPPLMPRSSCAHPRGRSPLDPAALEVVWFEEGDAAALLERGELLAVIPGWSGEKGFSGYARDCTAECPLAWPLAGALTRLRDRTERAREFWASWAAGSAWEPIQTALVRAIGRDLGKHSNYYAVDGGEWPPRFLVQIPRGDAQLLVTGGISIRPQPKVEQYENASGARRIELGLAMDAALLEGSGLDKWMSGQATFPWTLYTWLGHGHTIGCDVIPTGPSRTVFDSLVLLRDPTDLPRVELPDFRGDPVSLLWLVPITKSERAFAAKEGSDTLVERLVHAGHGAVHRDRESVV